MADDLANLYLFSFYPERNDLNKPINLPVKGQVKDPSFPKAGLNFLYHGEGNIAAKTVVRLEDLIPDKSMLKNSYFSVHVQDTRTNTWGKICTIYTSLRLSCYSLRKKNINVIRHCVYFLPAPRFTKFKEEK